MMLIRPACWIVFPTLLVAGGEPPEALPKNVEGQPTPTTHALPIKTIESSAQPGSGWTREFFSQVKAQIGRFDPPNEERGDDLFLYPGQHAGPVVIGNWQSQQTEHQLLDRWRSGKLKPGLPTSDVPTLVFLTGPVMNSGDAFSLQSVSRENDTLTVEVATWSSLFPRFKNIPYEASIIVSLGTLTKGDYTLRVIHSNYVLDPQVNTFDYGLNTYRVATRPFVVGQRENVDDAIENTFGVSSKDMKSVEPPDTMASSRFVRPEFRHRTLIPNDSMKGRTGVSVGSGDVPAWWNGDSGVTSGMLELQPAHTQSNTFIRLVSPLFNMGYAMQVGTVQRIGDRFSLDVHIWADGGPRRKNIPNHHVTYIRLGQLTQGAYELDVNWTMCYSTDGRQPCVPATQEQWHRVTGTDFPQQTHISFDVSD